MVRRRANPLFTGCSVAFLLIVFNLPAAIEPACAATGQVLDGITAPVSDRELSFVQPGKVARIMVSEGDTVRAGDVLMQQDDEIEKIQLKILTSRSQNVLPVQLAEIDLNQKRKDLLQITKAQEKGAITAWEVDHAALAVDAALLTLRIKEFERDQDVLKRQSVVESINRLTLSSPIDGRVEEVRIETGESVQALVPIVRIISNDPLIIDLPVPVDLSRTLATGNQGFVLFGDGEKRTGKIINISSVADAAATTLEVKIELPNPEGRPAGERVSVAFDSQPSQQQILHEQAE